MEYKYNTNGGHIILDCSFHDWCLENIELAISGNLTNKSNEIVEGFIERCKEGLINKLNYSPKFWKHCEQVDNDNLKDSYED